jgi:hypothetical protein
MNIQFVCILTMLKYFDYAEILSLHISNRLYKNSVATGFSPCFLCAILIAT